jgi:hypothetical protein
MCRIPVVGAPSAQILKLILTMCRKSMQAGETWEHAGRKGVARTSVQCASRAMVFAVAWLAESRGSGRRRIEMSFFPTLFAGFFVS